jgi:hypothetical protein
MNPSAREEVERGKQKQTRFGSDLAMSSTWFGKRRFPSTASPLELITVFQNDMMKDDKKEEKYRGRDTKKNRKTRNGPWD